MNIEKLENYPIYELEELKDEVEKDVYKSNKLLKDLRMKVLKLEIEQQDREQNLLKIRELIFKLTPKIECENNEDDFNPFDVDHVSGKS